MLSPADTTRRWLSIRVRILCIVIFGVASLLPPYVPHAELASDNGELDISHVMLLVEDGFLMKTSPLTKEGTRRAYSEGVIHTVHEGDSLERLSDRYDVSIDTIRWANKLGQGTAIQPGQQLLVLPVDGVLHTVKRGQTLLGIAELYGAKIEDIASQNRVKDGFIAAGQELIIPGGKPIVEKPKVVVVTAKPVGSTKPPAGGIQKPAQPSFTPAPTAGALQKPCSEVCFITQYFTTSHYALDMQERGGGAIYAAEAGTVIRADYGWNGGYGNVIEVDHGNGLVTLYGHNKSLLVEEGDTVVRGQQIANMGNTGLVYGKTGIHIHFEVQLNGVKKNPLLYLQ
ncbi:MAG: peptidase M23 family protein [Candidatus Peregrinibacteria bacterium Greene0416_62]|nr:MAG: peptidase M23 family protein [Candidatus Peregrinibacteria bacterium Greene0416_62]TSC99930.1 MAG: peptidase M23 family protein [Candidatus Peregrinibacteria bacterium Greene1014_49]